MDLSYSGIYQILHAADGRVYVGSAVHIGRRWGVHRRRLNAGKHHSAKLQNAWCKYGPQAFSFHVLERVDDKALLLEREQEWIEKTKAAQTGFNVLPTAGSHLGAKHSPETRQRMSEAHAGRPKSPEHAAKVADALRGRRMTDEQRQKMSAAKLGKTFGKRDPAIGQRISAANKGRKLTPEHREKLAAAKRGKKQPPELVAKRAAAIKAAALARASSSSETLKDQS